MKNKIDPEQELIKILSEELAKEIDREILNGVITITIEDDLHIINRDRKIESIVEDKEYKEMKKEDHPLYKKIKSSE